MATRDRGNSNERPNRSSRSLPWSKSQSDGNDSVVDPYLGFLTDFANLHAEWWCEHYGTEKVFREHPPRIEVGIKGVKEWEDVSDEHCKALQDAFKNFKGVLETLADLKKSPKGVSRELESSVKICIEGCGQITKWKLDERKKIITEGYQSIAKLAQK